MIQARPWYKEFWFWFIFGLPVLAAMACAVTILIAVQHPDPLISDHWYDEGQAINAQFQQAARARQMNLTGQLLIHSEAQDVQFTLQSDELAGLEEKLLILSLRHTTRPEWDQTSVLQLVASGQYRGHLTAPLAAGKYHLVLTPPEKEWRLAATVILPATMAITLQ